MSRAGQSRSYVSHSKALAAQRRALVASILAARRSA